MKAGPFIRSMKCENNIPLVSLLIENGALINFNCDSVEIDEQYPMIAAANDKNVIELLLSSGIDINFKTPSGWTSLHEACTWNIEESVSFLLQKGANINAETETGETPFYVLIEDGTNFDANSSITMIKELSKIIYKNLPVAVSDMEMIQNDSKAFKHFENCTAELKKMSNAIFYHPFSYYFVLSASKNRVEKLSKLTKNEEFIKNFKEKLHEFPYYKIDLARILVEAFQVRDETLTVESRLKYVFRDFFPDLVLRKLAENLTLKDLPLQ